jgi:hypothetical protein
MFIRKVFNKFDYIHVKIFSPNIIIYLYWHNYGEAIIVMFDLALRQAQRPLNFEP